MSIYCKECESKRHKTSREKHSDRIINYKKNNKDIIRERNKIYSKENREKINKRETNRRHLNPLYRLRLILSHRIREALKRQKHYKTIEYVGCSLRFLTKHLQQTAIDNGYLDFNINNYSGFKYHIDHIIPCGAFSNLLDKDQQFSCFHWSNLQILKSSKNESKGKKIITKIPDNMIKFIKPELLNEGNTNGLFKENNGR